MISQKGIFLCTQIDFQLVFLKKRKHASSSTPSNKTKRRARSHTYPIVNADFLLIIRPHCLLIMLLAMIIIGRVLIKENNNRSHKTKQIARSLEKKHQKKHSQHTHILTLKSGYRVIIFFAC